MHSSLPEDLVSVGHVTGAFGVQGWVRIHSYSADADALLHAKTWWLAKVERKTDIVSEVRDVERLQAKRHGEDIIASLMGIVDRDAAENLKGLVVQIQRSHFPLLSENEFYWQDLIGLAVENCQGESLGVVADLLDYGAHPILRVIQSSEPAAELVQNKVPAREYLIPFVEHFVLNVDQKNKKITVDWGLDY